MARIVDVALSWGIFLLLWSAYSLSISIVTVIYFMTKMNKKDEHGTDEDGLGRNGHGMIEA
jgi:hypothetical protein